MIYAKTILKIEMEMNIPMQGVESTDAARSQLEKEGGQDAFIKAMADEVIKGFSSPFTTGKLTSGTLEVVEV